jgi:hypothetical protein
MPRVRITPHGTTGRLSSVPLHDEGVILSSQANLQNLVSLVLQDRSRRAPEMLQLAVHCVQHDTVTVSRYSVCGTGRTAFGAHALTRE